MPKKGGGGAHDDEEKAEERLQAVVIATAFELGNAWAPLSFGHTTRAFPARHCASYRLRACLSLVVTRRSHTVE